MANQNHLTLLNQDVKHWNIWRKEHPEIVPDLRNADLHRAKLTGINFHRVQLDGADLRQAVLHSARLTHASLSKTNMSHANLSHANLSHANLSGTLFQETDFTETILSQAILNRTIFANVDLRTAKDIATIDHKGPSTIGLDTVERSKGDISSQFLQQAGVSRAILTAIYAVKREAFDYFTCFLSYSSKDEIFAKKLHTILQNNGVRCWRAPENLKPGEPFKNRIAEAIYQHDKLLVVLSQHSLTSPWVTYEVERARQKEHEMKQRVLFPLQLDTAILKHTTGWPASLQQKRHIAHFEQWKHEPEFQKAFKRLLEALKMES